MSRHFAHSMPFGAELAADGSVRFALWAPGVPQVDLFFPDTGDAHPMAAAEGGRFEATADGVAPGTAYAYRMPNGFCVPDPAARAQRDDVHGPSLVVDPRGYAWRNADWTGRPWHETVLYELHVGTATQAGTFAGIQRLLDGLAELGVTALELMPVADFPGTRNWGYDGALPFAPDRVYGAPDDLKALIDAAHERGLMVFLDVVYNHFGPDGNYLHLFSPAFFTDRHQTPWGAAIDFSVPAVRSFFIHNALYWVEEFRVDGLRFDAVHAIRDDSERHILDEIADAVRTAVDGKRHVHLVLENDANEARYLRGDPPAYQAQWNDDFHHAAHVLLTGERDGYYEDYADDPHRALGRALAEGFVYQGEPSPHRHGATRGEKSADLSPLRFVDFLQNHDQVGNRAFGDRGNLLTRTDSLRAMMAVLLLSPSVPMLFMGEEINSPAPFPFFCDFEGTLADAVREGRRQEFARFAAFADPAARESIPDPNAPETFAAARPGLDAPLTAEDRGWRDYVRTLLAIRRTAIAPVAARPFDGASAERFGDGALDVRWRFAGGWQLGLLLNAGDTPAATEGRREGRIVFASDDGWVDQPPAVLPPWSVIFWTAPA